MPVSLSLLNLDVGVMRGDESSDRSSESGINESFRSELVC